MWSGVGARGIGDCNRVRCVCVGWDREQLVTLTSSPSLQESESDSAPLTLIPIAARMALSCILLSLSIASRILHAV